MKKTIRLTESDLHRIVENAVSNLLSESFNSSFLRNWAESHGGIKLYDEYVNSKGEVERYKTMQDGLGDISDEDILYHEEFDSEKDAGWKKFYMKQPNGQGKRSDWDMRAHFVIYKANDGTCLLVGIDRKAFPTTPTWGGTVGKKRGDRVWRGKTADELKDTYTYHKKAGSFGVHTNKDFENLKNHNRQIRKKMTPEEWQEYMDMQHKGKKDYLDRYFYYT